MFKILKVIKNGAYNRALVPDHPKANKYGYVLEHRVIMENHLGRVLNDNELVHHINENTKDNRIENLEVVTNKKHVGIHHRKAKFIILECAFCHKSFSKRYNQYAVKAIKYGQKDFYCNRKCMSSHFGRGRIK